jgi:hypothetical protein
MIFCLMGSIQEIYKKNQEKTRERGIRSQCNN